VIADGTRRFDMIEAGYQGPLYAEISPRRFPCWCARARGCRQIRFRRGEATLTPDELDALHAAERLVDTDDADLTHGGVAVGRSVRRELGRLRRLSRQASHRRDRCRSPRRL
jgi:dCTP deaminase